MQHDFAKLKAGAWRQLAIARRRLKRISRSQHAKGNHNQHRKVLWVAQRLLHCVVLNATHYVRVQTK